MPPTSQERIEQLHQTNKANLIDRFDRLDQVEIETHYDSVRKQLEQKLQAEDDFTRNMGRYLLPAEALKRAIPYFERTEEQ